MAQQFKLSQHIKVLYYVLLFTIITIIVLLATKNIFNESHDSVINHPQISVISYPTETEVKNTQDDGDKMISQYLSGYMHNNDISKLNGYQRWILGLGNQSLSNENMTTCLFEPIQSTLYLSQIFNKYPLFENEHKCTDTKLKIFSSESNRIITVKCHKKDTAKYHQSNHIFNAYVTHHKSPQKYGQQYLDDLFTDFTEENIIRTDNDYNIYILILNNLTQNTWIKCGKEYNFHLTLLPLQISNPSLYKQQKVKYEEHNFQVPPPNIVIFAIDSTSRSNFIRSAPMTIDYLNAMISENNKNKNISNSASSSPSHIFQFFRHSTTGYRTMNNMNAILRGINPLFSRHNELFENYSMNLFEYYDKFGYNSVGYHDFITNKDLILDDNGDRINLIGTYGLSSYVFPFSSCDNYHKSGGQLFTEFVLSAIEQQKIDKIPYFMVVHTDANHIHNGQGMWSMDRYLRNMIEYLDLENTILHFTGDHGNTLGDALTNIYGQIEINNPMSILLLPKNKLNKIKYDENEILNKLRINQQRLISHFDFHLFWKQIPLLFTNKYGNYKDIFNIKWIYDTLPMVFDIGFKPSKSIMTQYISPNRSCREAGVDKKFCFCDVFQDVDLNEEQLKIDQEFLKFGLDTINNLTGNGNFHCKKLDFNNFDIKLHVKKRNTDKFMLMIQHKIRNDKDIMDQKESKLLSYIITFDYKKDENGNKLLYIPITAMDEYRRQRKNIWRLDYYKFEKCLTIDYSPYEYPQLIDKFPKIFRGQKRNKPGTDLEPIFKDKNELDRLIQNTDEISLGLCRCKGN